VPRGQRDGSIRPYSRFSRPDSPKRASIPEDFRANQIIQDSSSSPWPKSKSELYRTRERRLSAKLVSNFEDTGCHVVSVTDPYVRILGFLDRILQDVLQ
jgi:hypothetical protein